MSKDIIVGKQGFYATVDNEDYQAIIDAGKWHTCNNCLTIYARSVKYGYLHRFIMKPPKNMVVHHLDHNGLNNQKSNLQICTRSYNQKHKHPYKKLHMRNIFGF